MKDNASIRWRAEGDEAAFDHAAWEFKARQFASSARYVLRGFDDQLEAPTFEGLMLLPTAEFLFSLALELISKARYLKRGDGPREDIYSHDVLTLFEKNFLNPERAALLAHAHQYVVWAGRYPTPKWTKEKFKEGYDVPSSLVGNHEFIDSASIPNTASRPRVEEMAELYDFIRRSWAEEPVA